MKIGLIDSGIGGIKVLESLLKVYNGEYLYVLDKSFMPYGNKSRQEIVNRVRYCCSFLISKGVDVIVLACNTASCCALKECKSEFAVPIFGLTPPVSDFVESGKRVLVLATDLTTNIIKEGYGSENVIFEPLKDLAFLVETQYNNKELIYSYIENNIAKYKGKCDKVFLGCTHYYYFADYINKVLDVEVFDGRKNLVSQFEKEVKNLIQIKSNTVFYNL